MLIQKLEFHIMSNFMGVTQSLITELVNICQ